jgi:phosphatidylinositol-3-phosphatase
MNRRVVAAVYLTVCAIAAVACSSGTPPPGSGTTPRVTTPASASASSAEAASRPDHVVIVVLENKDESDVVREGPYLAAFAASGATLTDMHAETHPSQPNYLALFSGETQGVTDDHCPLTFDTPNLATELTAAGYSFVGYAEDLPEAGYTGCRAGDYARKHSPWTDFSTVPPTANQPLSAMPSDYTSLPTVSFVIPNLCHDMHDCSIAQGDEWLRMNVDGYAQWARSHNSLLIVTFDESESSHDQDNHIATLAVGELVTPGPLTQRTDHYGLLRTIQDLYGLPPLGHSAQAASIPGLWRAS